MARDPYEVLGLVRTAGAEDIKRAYRALARKLHPDLNPGDNEAEARFKEVNAANDLLSDPDRRARFDRGEIDADGNERGPPPRSGGGFGGGFDGGFDGGWRAHAEGAQGQRYRWRTGGGGGDEEPDLSGFEDLFRDAMRNGGGGRAGGPRRGADAQYALTISFLDAVRGATPRLTLPDGRTLDVKVPPGIETGQVLRLRGRGTPGRDGGPDGDALIEIVVSPHPVFERDGTTIRLELPVSVREAVLGEKVVVPTPAGEVMMKLPDGADTGTVLRLRGRGVAAHGSVPAGDLLATLRVVIGPRDATLAALFRDTPAVGPGFDPRADLLNQVRRAGEAA